MLSDLRGMQESKREQTSKVELATKILNILHSVDSMGNISHEEKEFNKKRLICELNKIKKSLPTHFRMNLMLWVNDREAWLGRY